MHVRMLEKNRYKVRRLVDDFSAAVAAPRRDF